MSRQRALPTQPIVADPSPGRWYAIGSRVCAYVDDDHSDILIADCELPGSDFDRQGPSNIDAVEQTRAVAKVNAKLMAQAKAMAEQLLAAYHAADHVKDCPYGDGVCTCWVGQADAVLRLAGRLQ